jgi:gliding motility-associated-like protein
MNSAITVNDYTWVFGDGTTASSSNSPTVVHKYNSPGTYDLSLSIHTNLPSCDVIQILTQKVSTLAGPVASFTTTPTNTVTCKDTLNVSFNNASTFNGVMTYAWNFGNGKTSTSASPAQQVYYSGNYNVNLTVKSNPVLPGCVSSTSKTITVGRPKLILKAYKDTVCAGEQIVVGTSTPGTYNWTIDPTGQVFILDSDGDGDFSGDEDDFDTIPDPNYNNKDSISISYTTPGTHTIILHVTTPDGQCTDIDSIKVYIEKVNATITSPTSLYSCQSPFNTTFNATSSTPSVQYDWSLSRVNPSYKGKNYLYYVPPKKVEDTTFKNTASFNWTFYSAFDSIYYSFNDSEIFLVSLTATSKLNGCKTKVDTTVNLWLPNAFFKINKSRGCAPLSVTFTDSSTVDKLPWSNSITSWEWIFDDGQKQVNSTGSIVSHTYNTPGVYYARLVIKTAKGCSDTSYAIPIYVGGPINTVDFTSDKTSVCPGDPIQFTVINPSPLINGYHFQVDNNRAFHCASDQTVSWSYDDIVGPQNVSLVMDYNGCISKVTKNNYITVNGAVAQIDYYSLCKDPMTYNYKNKSLGATSVSWNFGDGQSSTNDNIAHTYNSTGDYLVKLTATGLGCPSTIASAVVHVRKIKAKMNINPLLCINSGYNFSAASSLDVNPSCSSGYIWQFSNLNTVSIFPSGATTPIVFTGNNKVRPYTTSSSLSRFAFSDPGVHQVSLIVTDINGCKDTSTQTFKVYDMVVPAPLTDKTDICSPSLVTFKDKSTGDTTLVSWEWFLGDGTDTITLTNNSFSHLYTTPATGGSYPLILIVKDKLGCEEYVNSAINYYKPVSSITAPDFSLCFGDKVALSAPDFTSKGSHLAFQWDLGNGQTSTLQTIPPFAYPAGDYTVKLKYTEVATGCKDSTTAVVSVQDYPDVKIATNVDALPELCAPLQITFNDATVSTSPIVSRSWDFGNGHGTTDPSQTWSYDKGTYKVQLIESTSYGCADTATRIFKLARPEGDFTMSRNQICRYEDITFKMKDTVDVSSWRWAFGDGNTLDNKDSVTHKYDFHPPAGSTSARLILYKGTCPYPVEKPVFIYEVIASFARNDDTDKDSITCLSPDPSFSFINNSTGFDHYAWFFGDNTGSSDYNPTHTYKAPGTYNVTLAVDKAQCKDTLRKQVIVYSNPVIKAIGDTACQGNKLYPYVLNPAGTSTYAWFPSTGLSDPASTNPVASVLHTTDYSVTETDLHGCKDDTTIKAIVIENHLKNFDTTIVVGDEIALPAYGTPIYIFTWSPDSALSCDQCDYPKVRPLHDIHYDLNVKDVLNCFISDYTFDIHVRPETFIKMPSAFSPNGDNNNDILFVKGWGIKHLESFEIFNRWGQLLFKSSDLYQGWDGKFNGAIQNEDVYVFKVLATDWYDKELFVEGYVNLLH